MSDKRASTYHYSNRYLRQGTDMSTPEDDCATLNLYPCAQVGERVHKRFRDCIIL